MDVTRLRTSALAGNLPKCELPSQIPVVAELKLGPAKFCAAPAKFATTPLMYAVEGKVCKRDELNPTCVHRCKGTAPAGRHARVGGTYDESLFCAKVGAP